MRKLFFIIFISFCINETEFYDINLYGIKVATCKVSIKDTTFNNTDCIKIDYNVKTSPIMKWLFNVENNYITIIDSKKYNLLYFKKKTYQPKITNYIETRIVDDLIEYPNTSYNINYKEQNIFSLLYLISHNKVNNLDIVTLDREGKKYICTINKNNNIFSLLLKEKDENDFGTIENTDIFSWALFLPNTEKTVQINQFDNTIQSCRFKKGIMTFKAILINKKAPE